MTKFTYEDTIALVKEYAPKLPIHMMKDTQPNIVVVYGKYIPTIEAFLYLLGCRRLPPPNSSYRIHYEGVGHVAIVYTAHSLEDEHRSVSMDLYLKRLMEVLNR